MTARGTSVTMCSAFTTWYMCLMLSILYPLCSFSKSEVWPSTKVYSTRGHYPHYYCHLTNIMLSPREKTFFFKTLVGESNLDVCQYVTNIWRIRSRGDLSASKCEESYDAGHVFLFYYFYGSNYYHLHYDTMLPLYKTLYYQKGEAYGEEVLLMPSVETRRLQEVDWGTAAFSDPSQYWVTILQLMSGSHNMKPLNQDLTEEGKNLCFKNIYFGTERVDYTDADFVKSFIDYVKSELHIKPSPSELQHVWVGLISRSGRRRILNEAELVEAVKKKLNVDMKLLEFEKMSFQEQVRVVSTCTVLAGMNGAGFMNSLYLPAHSVAVQLVPYNSTLNFVQFGKLIKSRGSYMEWHNKHKDNHVPFGRDQYQNHPDTRVHIEEFVHLISQALEMARVNQMPNQEHLEL